MGKLKKFIFNPRHRSLEWKSKSLETRLHQYEGLDIVVTQKNGDFLGSVSGYSEPGHNLFACLLRFLKEKNNFPTLEEISTINQYAARETNNRDSFARVEFLLQGYEEQLPFFEDDKIKICSDNFGFVGGGRFNSFFAYVKKDNIILATNVDEGLPVVLVGENNEIPHGYARNLITLDQQDALIVMKGIYMFSPFNSVLKELYNWKKV